MLINKELPFILLLGVGGYLSKFPMKSMSVIAFYVHEIFYNRANEASRNMTCQFYQMKRAQISENKSFLFIHPDFNFSDNTELLLSRLNSKAVSILGNPLVGYNLLRSISWLLCSLAVCLSSTDGEYSEKIIDIHVDVYIFIGLGANPCYLPCSPRIR